MLAVLRSTPVHFFGKQRGPVLVCGHRNSSALFLVEHKFLFIDLLFSHVPSLQQPGTSAIRNLLHSQDLLQVCHLLLLAPFDHRWFKRWSDVRSQWDAWVWQRNMLRREHYFKFGVVHLAAPHNVLYQLFLFLQNRARNFLRK